MLHHAEGIRKKNGLFNFQKISFFQNGGNAVTFFFVLSGFLITYLLLKERNLTQTISVKNFYIKRVLRIWPLYFLLVALGTVVLPILFKLMHISYQFPYTLGQTWYYFLFFVPGLVIYFFGNSLLNPLWSIGVEEVFYLIWAPLLKFSKKNILLILVAALIIKMLLNLIGFLHPEARLYNYMIKSCFTFEDMVMGGLAAYFVFHCKKKFSNYWLFAKPIQVIVYLILIIFLVFDQNISFTLWKAIFHNELYSKLLIDLFFIYIIIGVSLVETNIIKLENKYLSFLGEISYGIYMYHVIIIFTLVLFLKKILANMNGISASILFFLILTVSVIVIATISKYTFENYFLRLKKKL